AEAPQSEPAPDSSPVLVDEDALLGVATRALALAALLGFSIATWLQLSFTGGWVNEFLAENVLPEGRRMTFVQGAVGGAALGAAICAYFVSQFRKKKRNLVTIERWLWFVSPLLLLPAVPSLFRYKPWMNEHERLLPIVLFLALALEILCFRALVRAPLKAREWWEELREQVPELVRRRGAFWVVVAGSLFYAAFFSFILLRWHEKLRTGNFDLSINNNLMFGGLHGRFLESTVVFPQEPGKYLANHAKFGGYLFLPIYALYPRAETLLVLQSVLIGAGAIPLWAFARRHLPEWSATIVALAYLAYYPMHGASFSEFQYVPIAAAFLFATVWAAEERRWVLMGVAAGMGMLMREDIPLGMALVGGFLALTGYRPKAGLTLAAVAMTYFVVLRFYVMDSAGDWWYPNMYKELWADKEKGFRSVIKTLISNPLYVFSKVLVEKKVIYLLHLMVPLVFLPARRWYLWAAFIPGALLTLLITNYDPPVMFSFHYVMHWAPLLFLAAVLALKSLGDAQSGGSTARRQAATIAFAAASLVLTFNYGAFAMRDGGFKGGFHKVEFGISDAERQRYQNLKTLAAMIPDDASVAATEKLGPHVSARLLMYTMRHGPQGAEWILASSRELKLSRTKPKLFEVVKDGSYGVVKRIDDLALLKRGHDTSGNAKLIRDWRLAELPKKDRDKDRDRDRDKDRERDKDRDDKPREQPEPADGEHDPRPPEEDPELKAPG
ncbi:MAG: DUF2079 domain-containing protein, partial [Myxococcota bacterium]|nr:DUF2079 domain-containing protein [Myxococcota bacterium]